MSSTEAARKAAALKAAETRRRNRAEASQVAAPAPSSNYSSVNQPAPFTTQAPVISLRIVRETNVPAPAQLHSPQGAYEMLRERYADADREILVAVSLDTKNKVIGIHPVYYGSLNSALIRINEVFKAAISLGAAAILIAHNHPSGDPSPSPEDVQVTRQIVQAGQLLDIEVMDHIVLGDGRFVSMRERELGFVR